MNAIALEKRDPEAADRAYRKLIEDVKNSPDAPDVALCNIYEHYGDFVFDNFRFPEALTIYKNEEVEAKKIKSVNTFESGSLVRQAFTQHYLFEDGKGQPPDPEIISRSMKLRPDDISEPTRFRGNCYRNHGLMYMDTNDYAKADQFFQKAIADYKTKKDEDTPSFVLDAILYRLENFIKQKKFAEANKLYIESLATTQEDERPRLTFEYLNYLRSTSPQLKEISAHVRKSLEENNFADLDALSDKLTSEATISPSGHWGLDFYFDDLNSLKDTQLNAVWKKRIDTFKQWQMSNPDSAAAPVALAKCLTAYGWKARGSGWAHEVTQEGWKLFEDRLQQAYEALGKAKHKNPCWYRAAQVVALGQGWDDDKYNALVAECRKQYPTYYPAIFTKAYRILPKWHGGSGDVAKYADEQAHEVSGPDGGDVLYARIAWSLVNQTPPAIKGENMSWSKIKSGFETLKKRFPNAPIVRGVLSAIAMEYGDKSAALNAFK